MVFEECVVAESSMRKYVRNIMKDVYFLFKNKFRFIMNLSKFTKRYKMSREARTEEFI